MIFLQYLAVQKTKYLIPIEHVEHGDAGGFSSQPFLFSRGYLDEGLPECVDNPRTTWTGKTRVPNFGTWLWYVVIWPCVFNIFRPPFRVFVGNGNWLCSSRKKSLSTAIPRQTVARKASSIEVPELQAQMVRGPGVDCPQGISRGCQVETRS